jgi:uncharacterized protein YbaP (TraB family)
MKSIIIAGLATLAFSIDTSATSVWKVENADSHLYIGGTIHVLSESDYPLPDAFNEVYAMSQELIFETDIAQANSPQFQAKLVNTLSYPQGKTIADDLNPETLALLKDYMAKRGLPYEQFAAFKASLLGVTIAAIEMQIAGIVAAGVDSHFHSKANADEKSVAFLESLDAQIAAIASMGEGQEDAFIRYSLDWAQQTGETVKDLTAKWRRGDTSAVSKDYVIALQKDYPEIYDAVLVDRNNKWIPQIEAMFNDQDIELVLVGLLHLAGEHSVLKQLKDKGYSITQIH